MAEAEAPIPSLKDRIAALQLNQVRLSPATPPPPSAVRPRSVTTIYHPQALATSNGNGHDDGQPRGGDDFQKSPPPVLPPRQQTDQRPSLPPRTPSEHSLKRIESRDSVASTLSRQSSASHLSTQTSNTPTSRKSSFDVQGAQPRVRAPAYDPNTLPPLPVKKVESKRPPLTSVASTPKLPSRPTANNRSHRPSLPASEAAQELPTLTQVKTEFPAANGASRPLPRKSALSYGLNKSTETAPAIPNRPGGTASVPQMPSRPLTTPPVNGAPPPVPLGSRPNLAQLQASKPQFSTPNWNQPAPTSCLKCRDFTAPDNHAARFPREAIPSTDLSWLSQQLTSPFHSATEKARAIFTWLHYNIDYDVVGFFGGTCKPSTPASTLASGLAVCEGYAGLFAALCIQAGLESVVISGHGKGFGHKPLMPGEPMPPFSTNHAWNAVKIDNGEWKLVEPCWGAGYVQGPGKPYTRKFKPEFFTMDNEEFGLRHYPSDISQLFRPGGTTISWEEYMIGPDGPGEDVQVYSVCVDNHGFDPTSILPKKKHIRIRGLPATSKIQFQVQRVCEHWDKLKPYVYVLSVGGRDGRKREEIPFQTNGYCWWLSVEVQKLGCSGQTVSFYAVTTIGGLPARGYKIEDYSFARKTSAVAFEGIAAWQLDYLM